MQVDTREHEATTSTPTADLLQDYLTKDEAAAVLSIHPYTLKRWRMRGYGPQAVKVGGRVRYRLSDIQHWLASLGASDAKAG